MLCKMLHGILKLMKTNKKTLPEDKTGLDVLKKVVFTAEDGLNNGVMLDVKVSCGNGILEESFMSLEIYYVRYTVYRRWAWRKSSDRSLRRVNFESHLQNRM
jgi:hypothetical protein